MLNRAMDNKVNKDNNLPPKIDMQPDKLFKALLMPHSWQLLLPALWA